MRDGGAPVKRRTLLGGAMTLLALAVIAAVGAPQLARQGILRLSDLQRVVPGFSFTESQVGTPVYTLRGVGFQDISMGGRPTGSVYSDQAPIPFTIETLGGNLDLERIEVRQGSGNHDHSMPSS